MLHSQYLAINGALVALLVACTGTLEGNIDGSAGTSSGGTVNGGTGGGAGTSAGAANDAGPGDAGGAPPIDDAGPALSGPELFAASCAPCHGVEGQGSPLGPELQHPVADYATWVARHGRATNTYPVPMAAYDTTLVSVEQLGEIWLWLGSFPMPSTGQGLYEDYCANCHGADALGGRVGKRIDDQEIQDVEEKVREGEGGNNFASTAQYMPHWSSAELSSNQLALIAEYITGL